LQDSDNVSFPKIEPAKKAFTLTELLVTISIIGLLSALSVVGIKKAVASAQRTKAASGLRQMGLLTMSYVTDNDGYLPGPVYYGTPVYYNTGDNDLLTTKLLPYTGITPGRGDQLLPFLEFSAEKKIRQRFRGQRPPVWVSQSRATNSAGQQVDPLGHRTATGRADPQKFAKLERPSTTWYLQDVDRQSANSGDVGQEAAQSPSPWHGDVRLSLYFDGRVEARPRSESDRPR
jgi:prepilin-type N-terminal cleavage/methylation domain-containing protein